MLSDSRRGANKAFVALGEQLLRDVSVMPQSRGIDVAGLGTTIQNSVSGNTLIKQ